MGELQVPRITTPKDTFTVDYPEAVKFSEDQAKVFWPHSEIRVEDDKHNVLTRMDESERHGLIETLRLLTSYEQIIGNEFWLDVVFKNYPRPADIQPMAAMFAAMELQVHAKFYAKINETLGLATDEFYNSYKLDPVFDQRIKHLRECLSDGDDLLKVGKFCFAEGAVLYSLFAFIKHFKSAGKNLASNIVSGVDFTARDENLHAMAAGWLFKQHKLELIEEGAISEKREREIEDEIIKAALTTYEHENLIIAKIFEKGNIKGVTATQLTHFVESRINLCMRYLGYANLFIVNYNPIADWFYKGITGYQSNDFFNGQGSQYQRDWSAERLSFKGAKERRENKELLFKLSAAELLKD